MARKASPRGRGKKTPAKASAPEAASGRGARDPQPPSFPVVAVGASAGGLEAFRELFAALPATTGMAFVLIQHLDPRHKSLLAEILRRTSTMPVVEVTDGMRVEPNHVFVMPPNGRMTISEGILGLAPREAERHHLPIDRFFFSLAADQKSRAIGIVLSGTDEDGTKGLRAIKAAGGMTFAQDEESAQFETMPRSAVEKGSVDLVLAPAKIAAELVRLAAHPPISGRDLLTHELEAMKEYVRTLMEEHERIESDIHAASQELQSTNEELQSTNEELETAKEEVQSANEELTTLNEELGNQNRELIQLGDDMSNLLGSVDIAIVIVDGDLRIRRLNKTAEKKLNLITTDIGRPITGLRLPVDLPDVEPLIREALSTLTMTEHQLQDTQGRWHSLRIRPYRTIRNVIDGVVMTLVDIDDLRRSLGDEKQARERAEAAETRWSLLAEAGLLLSSIDYETTLKAVAELATPRFAEWVTVDIAEEDGAIRHLAIAHVIPAKTALVIQLRDLSSAGDETSFGSRKVLQTGQAEFLPVVGEDVASLSKCDPRWLRLARALDVRSLICVPLTARGKTLGTITFAASGKMRPYEHADLRLAEELGRRAGLAIDNAQLFKAVEDANRFKDDFLATLSHELRTPMTAVLGWTQLLQLGQLDGETRRRAIDTIETSTKIQLRLIEDLLDISRITTGKMRLELVTQPLRPVLEAALETVRPAAEAKRIRIERRFDAEDAVVAGDSIRLEQVFWNLLINAVKFTPPESEVVIELEKEDSFARIRVRDTGEGIAPKFLPHVFERFRQDDRAGGGLRKGLGLGLAIARQLVELHGGTIEAASPGAGQGATFTVKLPLVG